MGPNRGPLFCCLGSYAAIISQDDLPKQPEQPDREQLADDLTAALLNDLVEECLRS